MNSKQIASVAVFFLGMLAFLFSIELIQALITMPYYPEELGGKTSLAVFAYVFPLLLLLAAGTAMVLRRHQLAAWIIAGSEPEMGEPSGEISGLPALLFAISGILLVVATLPSLGGFAGGLIRARAWPGFDEAGAAFWTIAGHYVGTLIQLVVGAYLFLHSRSLGRWWEARMQPVPESVEAPPNLPVCPHCETPFDPADYDHGSPEKRCSKCGTILPESAFVRA